MKLNAEEQRAGAIWFFGALVVGIALTVWLAAVDLNLTYSDKEIKHAKKLRELRIAQSSLQTGSRDPRKN